MFKNRALQVKMVRDDLFDPHGVYQPEGKQLTPEEIEKIAKEVATHTAITIGAVVAGVTIVNTLSKIAIVAAKAKFK